MFLFGRQKTRTRQAKPRRRRIEAIDMQAKRFGYFPRAFMWRGKRYEVCDNGVERIWTTGSRAWGSYAQRHYFRVVCVEGTFELFQDITHNLWYMAKFERAK